MTQKMHKVLLYFVIPPREMVAESDDGLLFSTVQVYSPPVVTVRVCVYCAVSGLSNTVSVPSVTLVVESLVQVTGSRSTSGDTGEGQFSQSQM